MEVAVAAKTSENCEPFASVNIQSIMLDALRLSGILIEAVYGHDSDMHAAALLH